MIMDTHWYLYVSSDGQRGTIFPWLILGMTLVYPYFYYYSVRFSLIFYAIVDFFWRFFMKTDQPTVK